MKPRSTKAARSEGCGGASVGKSVEGHARRRYQPQHQKQFVSRVDASAAWHAVYRHGERLGEVRRAFGVFVARTRLGATLGDFVTADAAVGALERGAWT
jgi:hypothetical protein